MAIYGTLGEVDLGALDASISDTAVDVFVYDTSKDSDGGAWRYKTQRTSWYNETLNTATRGSRREFPAVAVIVASTSPNKVTVYDGDDPNLPMWMVFTSNANQFGAIFNNRSVVSILAVNGSIIWGDSLDSVIDVSFIKDNYVSTAASGSWNSSRNILDRNPTDTNNLWTNYNSSRQIVSYPINDIAITVLPRAPIDSDTGLQIPTIAVGTDGGVSVIKDDGTVVDAVGTTFDVVNSISFDKNNRIICSSGTAGTDQAFFSTFSIPSVDLSHVFPGGDNGYYRDGYSSTDLPWYGSTGSAGNHSINEVSSYGDYISFGTEDDGSTSNPGLKILSENITTPSEGMLCGVSTSYNTGWMYGDIKGAFLADTDDTNVSAVVVNASTSDWSQQGTYNWTITSATEITVSSVTSGQSAGLRLTTDSSKHYVYSFNITVLTDNLTFRDDQGDEIEPIPTSTGVYTGSFTGTSYVDFTVYQNDSATVTDIDIREVEEDRSVNENGLGIYGTVAKSVVASGAELVAYGPFSTSNYLRQPYNSDLNFGSDDFSIMFWIYDDGTNSHQTLVSRDNREFDISRLGTTYGSKLRIYGWDNNGGPVTFDSSSNPYTFNKWNQICVTYTGGGIRSIYINGELNNSGVKEYNIRNTTHGFNIGIRNTAGSLAHPASGCKLALVRISGTAPSAEQIKKIYEDEKVLFQENAACTLYGSSDAVTALAYDPTTSLLHVGTSSGRSDFTGLKRINHNTSAVSTAISAQDGLIAQQ